MPKVRPLGQPRREPHWRELEDRIVERYGMLLTTAQLGKVIGMTNYDKIKLWAKSEDILPRKIGSRNKWDSRDIAKAIDNAINR